MTPVQQIHSTVSFRFSFEFHLAQSEQDQEDGKVDRQMKRKMKQMKRMIKQMKQMKRMMTMTKMKRMMTRMKQMTVENLRMAICLNSLTPARLNQYHPLIHL